MYFKIEKGYKVFDAVNKCFENRRETLKAYKNFAKKYGAGCTYHDGLGEISFGEFVFDETPDLRIFKEDPEYKYIGYCTPNKRYKAGKELAKRVSELPRWDKKTISDAIKLYPENWINKFCAGIGFKITDEFILLDLNAKQSYVPVEGMVEIVESEFKRLWKNEI